LWQGNSPRRIFAKGLLVSYAVMLPPEFLVDDARSRRFVAGFAKRSSLGEFARRLGHIGALMLEIVRYRPAQIWVCDIMRGIGGLRQIPARDLVSALGAGLDR